jgi:hypothetical protein
MEAWSNVGEYSVTPAVPTTSEPAHAANDIAML